MTVDLDALEQALSASTAGEWTWTDSGYTGWTGWEQWYSLEPYTGVKFDGEALNVDAQFIALAHNVMPALLTELRENRTQIAALVHALRLTEAWLETPEETKRLDEIYSEDLED